MKTAKFVSILVSTLVLASCKESVVPVAAVTFKTVDEQAVRYSADVSYAYPHIYVYENESLIPNPEDPKYVDNGILYRLDCENASILYISFNKNMGRDEIYNTTVMYVDITHTAYMSAYLKKTYSIEKFLYLNGIKLVPSTTTDLTTEIHYTFDFVNLKRTNPGGVIQNIINTLELK